MKALIIFNPCAGSNRYRAVNNIADKMRQMGHEIELCATQSAGHATSIVQKTQGSNDDFDAIIAAGGDGTINEVINGFDTKKRQLLSIIPFGTANVLAHELGATRENAPYVLQSGQLKNIYMGLMGTRRFTMMAGVGFDSWSVKNVDTKLKAKIGPLAYGVSLLKSLKTFKSHSYSVLIDGSNYEAKSVLIMKGQRYGGPFILAKNISLNTPEFEVFLFQKNDLLSILRYGISLAMGRMNKLKDVKAVTGKSIDIIGPDGTPVQVDGDHAGFLPINLTIEKNGINILVPEK